MPGDFTRPSTGFTVQRAPQMSTTPQLDRQLDSAANRIKEIAASLEISHVRETSLRKGFVRLDYTVSGVNHELCSVLKDEATSLLGAIGVSFLGMENITQNLRRKYNLYLIGDGLSTTQGFKIRINTKEQTFEFPLIIPSEQLQGTATEKFERELALSGTTRAFSGIFHELMHGFQTETSVDMTIAKSALFSSPSKEGNALFERKYAVTVEAAPVILDWMIWNSIVPRISTSSSSFIFSGTSRYDVTRMIPEILSLMTNYEAAEFVSATRALDSHRTLAAQEAQLADWTAKLHLNSSDHSIGSSMLTLASIANQSDLSGMLRTAYTVRSFEGLIGLAKANVEGAVQSVRLR